MDKQLNYDAIFNSCKWEFQHAIKSLNLNVNQAFGYAYDERESVLRNPSPWVRVAAYTALFKCASKYDVPLLSSDKDDPFIIDLKNELLEVFATYDRLVAIEEIPVDFRHLQADLVVIREKFGNWAPI